MAAESESAPASHDKAHLILLAESKVISDRQLAAYTILEDTSASLVLQNRLLATIGV